MIDVIQNNETIEILNLKKCEELIFKDLKNIKKTFYNTTLYGKSCGRMSSYRLLLNSLIYEAVVEMFPNEEDDFYLYKGKGNRKEEEGYRHKCAMYFMEKHGKDLHVAGRMMAKIFEKMKRYTEYLHHKVSYGSSMFDLIELAEADNGIRAMLNSTNISKDSTPEAALEKRKEMTEYMKSVINEKKIEPLYTILNCGYGLRLPQFMDMTTAIVLRPDGNEAMPYLIRESWYTGLKTVDSYFVENVIGRNATIITKMKIQDTGVLGKRLALINQDNYMNPNPSHSCDTITTLTTLVNDENIKKLELVGRWINEGDDIILLTEENLKSYMGKEIALRSPLTCNCQDGICRFCMQEEIYWDNIMGHEGAKRNIGSIASKDASAGPGQKYLSAKHFQGVIIGKYVIYFEEKGIELNIERKFNRIVFNKNVHSIIPLKPEYNSTLERFEFNAVSIDGYTLRSDGTCMYCYTIDDKMSTDELFYSIPHQNIGQDFLILNEAFNGKGSLEHRLEKMDTVLAGRPRIIREMLLRGLLFVKKGNILTRPDFSISEGLDAVAVPMETAIKNSRSLSSRMQIGFMKPMITDSRIYDKEYCITNSADIFLLPNKKESDDEEGCG